MRQVSIILISTFLVFIFKAILDAASLTGWRCMDSGYHGVNINDVPLIIVLCLAINKFTNNKTQSNTFSQ
jgi:hypothetical protein